MKVIITNVLIVLLTCAGYAQTGKVGVNTTDPKATLDVQSTSANTTSDVEGLLIPRVSKDKAYNMGNATTTPEESTMIYVSDTTSTAFSGGSAAQKEKVGDINENGFYYWNGDKWVKVSGKDGDLWVKNAETGNVELVDAMMSNEVIYTSTGYRRYPKNMPRLDTEYDYTKDTPVTWSVDSLPYQNFTYALTDSLIGEVRDVRVNGMDEQRIRNYNENSILYVNGFRRSDKVNYLYNKSSSTIVPSTQTDSLYFVRNTSSTVENRSSGNIGINTALLGRILEVGSGNTSNTEATSALTLIDKTGGSVHKASGSSGAVSVSETNQGEITGALYAGRFSLGVNGSGDINKIYGTKITNKVITNTSLTNHYTGTINTTYGTYIDGFRYGTVNNYGLYIGDVRNNDTTSVDYSIYTKNGMVSLGDTLQVRNIASTEGQSTDKVVVADDLGIFRTMDASSLAGLWKKDTMSNTIALVDSMMTHEVKYTLEGYEKNYPKGVDSLLTNYNGFGSGSPIKIAPTDPRYPNLHYYLQSDNPNYIVNDEGARSYLNAYRQLLVDSIENSGVDNYVLGSIDKVLVPKTYSDDIRLVRGSTIISENQGSGNMKYHTSLVILNKDGSAGESDVARSVSAVNTINKPSGSMDNASGYDAHIRLMEDNAADINTMRLYSSSIQLGGSGDVGSLYGFYSPGIDNRYNFTGKVNKYYGFYFRGVDQTYIDTAYGVYVDDVINASKYNYSIFTNVGKVSLGDTLQVRNIASTVGQSTDKVVVADASGVLKTLPAKPANQSGSLNVSNATFATGVDATAYAPVLIRFSPLTASYNAGYFFSVDSSNQWVLNLTLGTGFSGPDTTVNYEILWVTNK